MITLRTLAKETEVQGDVRISIWDDMGEEEIEVHEFFYVSNLAVEINRLPNCKQLYQMKVHFIFASGDGFLHIELIS